MKPVTAWNLTERETEVMHALARVGCQKRIARELGVEPKTIHTHMANIYEKTDCPPGGGRRVLVALAWDRHYNRDGVSA